MTEQQQTINHLLRLGWDQGAAHKLTTVIENRYRDRLTWSEIRQTLAQQVVDGDGPRCVDHAGEEIQYARAYLAGWQSGYPLGYVAGLEQP